MMVKMNRPNKNLHIQIERKARRTWQALNIKFLSTFSDKKKILKKFEILIEPKTLRVINKPCEKLPQWTELTFCCV
jgi:hypothetical protein